MGKRKGFTLIEIIVTMVLLAVIAVTVGLFTMAQMQAVARSGEYTIAFNLARLELETVNNLAYASLPVGTVTTNNYKLYSYTVIRTVSYVFGNDAAAESLKQVLIEVRKSNSSETIARLVIYLVKNTSIGL